MNADLICHVDDFDRLLLLPTTLQVPDVTGERPPHLRYLISPTHLPPNDIESQLSERGLMLHQQQAWQSKQRACAT